jgi:hypothetical protein
MYVEHVKLRARIRRKLNYIKPSYLKHFALPSWAIKFWISCNRFFASKSNHPDFAQDCRLKCDSLLLTSTDPFPSVWAWLCTLTYRMTNRSRGWISFVNVTYRSPTRKYTKFRTTSFVLSSDSDTIYSIYWFRHKKRDASHKNVLHDPSS